MVDGIVKDEHVDAIRMSQGSERVIDDGGGNLCRESAPVDSARVHEAVERILAKRHSGALERKEEHTYKRYIFPLMERKQKRSSG